MADRPRTYLDSCCFIDLAKQAVGLLPSARTMDCWFTWKLLEAHKDREIDVLTSVLTIAECTHADGNSEQPVRELFQRLLMSGQYCHLVQPTPFVGSDARDLRWKHGIALRGPDGLHVASALFMKAAEILTTDDKIARSKPAIEGLGLLVSNPAKTTCLPLRYRQEEIFDEKVTVLRPAGKKPA
jgi:hypothetical protein